MAKKVKNFILPNGEEIDVSGANEDLSNLSSLGQAKLDAKANKDLSNLSSVGQAKLDAKANDSTVVHKTGNETIAGTKTFSSTISGSVNGSAEFSKYLGNHNETASSSTANAPSSGMAKTSGLFLTGTYNDSATPASYGNIINIAGNGSGQLLCEWSGTDNRTGNVYYRSHRDTSTGGWGAWKKLAFTTDNVTSATKATQDSSGQQINTTYIKGVTASNATITVTKGNGTTSTATINNVANATSATKATQDSSGNQINTSYMPLKYSKYSISTYASSNPYIKLATFTISNTQNYDNSVLFWVEILTAGTAKAYALCKLSARWGSVSYGGTSFEILEKYGESSLFKIFDTLTWAYKYTTASSKGSVVGEIWMSTHPASHVTYYLRPTECNEYGDYSMTPVTMASNPWTYYNKGGTSTAIASTAITSGYTQVKVTDKSIRYYEPLLSHRWSDHLLNDVAWLRADTFSWQSGTTYSLAYNELLSEYNNSASVTQTDIIEKKWVQPILTANGTLGGSSFAVSADTEYSGRTAYMSFDDNYATRWGKNNTTTGNLIFYNPTKIKITKITQNPVTNNPAEDYGTYTLYGSNDNSTWTQLCQITVEASKPAEYIPTNPNFYNYYKINQSGGHNYAGTGELTITATELIGTITYKRTPKGYKIALASQETAIVNKYNSDGIAWYYILDNGNDSILGGLPPMDGESDTIKRFKLPRTKFGFEGLRNTVGDDIKESVPSIKGQVGYGFITDQIYQPQGAFYREVSSKSKLTWGGGSTSYDMLSFDASRSSSIYQDGAPVQERATQMYLYFYVGGFTKSAEAQTAGLKAEQLNSKVDISSLVECQVVTETYINGTSGYRIWSDGYCEQWGSFGEAYTGYKTKTITFLKNFKDTNYCLIHTMSGTGNQYAGVTNIKTVSSFSVINSLNYNNLSCWKACGYLA